jgi:polyisoprenoid-binding protein YceI
MTATRISIHSVDPTPIRGAWSVHGEDSHARFVASTLRGALQVPGAFGALSGRLVVDDEGASGVLTIDAASVDTGNRLRDHHLHGRDFFVVAKHPQLRYELRALSGSADDLLRLEGDLLVAGTRTALALEATLRMREDGGAEIACRTTVDRVALGLRGARLLVPRAVEVDVLVILRPDEG